MAAARWHDLSYPGEHLPLGVLEGSIRLEVRDLIADLAVTVGSVLRSSDRNVLSDCGFATIAWASALAPTGLTVRRVGGFGEHEVTVPPTPVEQLGGYATDDDGLIQHWWLMIDPNGSVIDPTAHQFDHRGGIELERYRVEGTRLEAWRRDWPAAATHFPIVVSSPTDPSANIRRRLRR